MLAECGDFRRLAPPNPVDAVITDPPYNIGHDYGPVPDNLPTDEYLALMADFAKWAHDNTAEDAHLFVVHSPRFFFMHGRDVSLDAGGWDYRQSIRWCYPSNIGHSRKKWTSSSRDVLWFTKGDPYFNSKGDPEPYRNPTDKRIKALIESGAVGRAPYDWWQFDLQKNVGRDYAGYSNQLPRPLLRRIVLSATRPGGAVADPFAGTGSTLDVAQVEGRLAWGCDANPGAPCFNEAEPNPINS